MRWPALCLSALLAAGSLLGAGAALAQEAPGATGEEATEAPFVPPAGNDPKRKEPPAVPEAAPSQDRARLLVEAIRQDKPELAAPFFFPQDAFRRVKGIKDPDRYFRKLMRVYLEDVRAMRKLVKNPAQIEFVSFSLGRQKRWVARGKEANALPYWANYKARVVVKDGDRLVTLPLRVIITWDGGWYVTHLTRK
jgi:hypothetical protein